MSIRVSFFSSSRADSGLLTPLIRRALEDSRFDVRVIATGAHLAESQGKTMDSELAFLPRCRLRVLDFLGGGKDLVQSTPAALGLFLDELESSKPEICVVLGDRLETLLFGFTTSILKIPLVHIHGGDVTVGAVYELHRHALTKLSALHFPASDSSAQRLIQMGEDPGRVHSFGSLFEENLSSLVDIGDKDFLAQVPLSRPAGHFLISMHACAFDNPPTRRYLAGLFEVLSEFPDKEVIFTAANLDTGGEQINQDIVEFVKDSPQSRHFVANLGAVTYLETLRRASVGIGNSSSLVLEAPRLWTPTVILGKRQLGRVDQSEVTGPTKDEIKDRILQAMGSDLVVRQETSSTVPTSLRILDRIFVQWPFSAEKRFHDL